METELMKEMITKAGGDANTLPDNLITTYWKKLGDTLGVDMSNLPDNLVTTHMQAIIDGYTGGGGGNSTYNVEYIVGEEIEEEQFFDNDKIKKVSFPNVTTIAKGAFSNCSALTEVDLPNATTIGSESFYNCDALTKVDFPKVKSIGENAFGNCNLLTEVNFPNATSIGEYAFNDSALSILIIRTPQMCEIDITSLVDTNIVTMEGVPTGVGFIYVPTALLESYIADFIPKIIALATAGGMPMDEPTATYIATAIFRPLEDYTVDGTITGELDESKI